jgi:hypothetical protein
LFKEAKAFLRKSGNLIAMQNINPLFILQPVIVIVISTVLLLFWYRRRRFHWMVLAYSLVAYTVAIALKYVVQIPTYDAVEGYFGSASVGLGVYLGLQTVFFEVCLAYLVAWYVVNHGLLERKDAEAYGSGLAFWENAGLLGIISLINLVTIYSILASNTPLAQTVYNQLTTNQPGLFASTSAALANVAWGTLERISSIMMHFAWGYLCFMAVILRKKRLFLVALPMGFVDFLVPFSSFMGTAVFEAVVFALSVLSVYVAWHSVKLVSKVTKNSLD